MGSSWIYPIIDRVNFGTPAATAVDDEVKRHDNRRVFIITSVSVAKTALLSGIISQLGERYVGTFERIRPHIPLSDVFAAAEAARCARADLILAVGGGSAIDAAKVVIICLGSGARTPEELAPFRGFNHIPDPSARPADMSSWVRMIAVPTTLSAAEFTWFGGGLDEQRRIKEPYAHPLAMARAIILDPAATLTAPMDLLLATGMKAVDHAVERVACNVRQESLNTARCAQSLRMLTDALPKILESPDHLAPRLMAQHGMAIGMAPPTTGVGVGASHSIGHALGGHAGVQHGLTSCVMLPHVMRWNAPFANGRQSIISDALGRPDLSAGDGLETLVQALKLPTRLREIGVSRDQLSAIAEKAFVDHSMRGNIRQPTGPEEITELLEGAW